MSEFKIHHHINEMFSLIGIDPASAEKYAETVKKSLRPFVSTQVSASNAVHILAEHAPDPQAFLSKYEELKTRNAQGLDPLMVLMGGIVSDKKVQTAVESVSKRKFDEEGVTVPSTVPSVLLEIEQATSTKLSADDLIVLRQKLIQGSQHTHSSGNASQCFLKTDKQLSSTGPSIPAWLSTRPYLTRNFMVKEGSDSKPVGPLGEVVVTAQEHQLLEDLLSLMTGIEGTYITLDPTVQPGQPPSFCVDSSVEPSLRALVSRILPLCSHYSQVVQFMEEGTKYHSGLVNQALVSAIKNLLKDYMLLVTQLESQHRRGALTLHKLWFYIEKTLTLMELLATISTTNIRSRSRGGPVLSFLHEQSRNLTGCGQLQDVIVYLSQAAAAPYMKMVALWIFRGIIKDPYYEFMVIDNEILSVGKETQSSDALGDDYWEKRYTLIPENIPSFLQMHSDIILRTGKYLNVIHDADPNVVCPEQEELIYSVHDRSYADIIDRTYNFASKKLLKLLMEEKDLMGRLRSMKHYFLLDQGDFVVQLLGLCEGELSKNIDDVLPNRLESLLELALRTSTANCDVYKDDVHCTLLPYTLMSQMLQILSIQTEEEPEYRSLPERLQLSGLQGFSLTYHVTWPVSLVLDRKSHFCYQMIFRHLFYCKHVERLLCRVWVSNKVARKFPLSSSQTYASAFTLRQRMLYFIQNLEYYMMFEVIERNWQTFLTKMQKVENVDEVLACHSYFLDGCLEDCMLTSPELLRIVTKVTNICVDFADFILSPDPSSATCHEESESFEQNIARFDLQFTGMLVTLMDKISDKRQNSHRNALVNVLYRLDFNNYYTQKGEGVYVPSSPESTVDFFSGPVSG